MTEDLGLSEELIAVHVIAMMMRKDESRDVFACRLLRRGDEAARRNRTLERIDRQQIVASGDDPGV
jgi:hypothetical protein